jgi:hypothetical protein
MSELPEAARLPFVGFFKLTRDASIKLNGRVSLRRRENQLIAILEALNPLFRSYCLNLAAIGSDNQQQTGRQGESRGIQKTFSTQAEDSDRYFRAAFDPSIRGIASPS